MRKTSLLIIIAILITTTLKSQDEFKLGNWRAHFPYHQLKHIAYDPPLVWGAGFSGLFSYNFEDYNIERYNILNGLSDVGITALKIHPTKKVLIIGYQNGNIDILTNGGITNISDIKRADIIEDKTIKSIKIGGDTVFIATTFGINLLDINNFTIITTYKIETSNRPIKINDVALLGDSIFIATNKGVYSAPRYGSNLLDYNNWKILGNLPYTSVNYDYCEAWADTLWIGRQNEGYQNDEMILYRNGQYRNYQFIQPCDIRKIKADNKTLHVVSNNDLYMFDHDGTLAHRNPYFGYKLEGPNDLVRINDWVYYVADPFAGLIRMVKYQEKRDTITPNGPAHYQCSHINVTGDEVWVSGGSRGNPWSRYGIYRFKNNSWQNYNYMTSDSLKAVSNISISITNPTNPAHIIAGSYGDGIVEFIDGNIVKTWGYYNSPLEPAAGLGVGYIRIAGMTFDNKQNLWISQWGAINPLAVKRNDGKWQKFNLNNEITKKLAGEMVSTPWGDIWTILEDDGILVFNPDKLLNNQPNSYKIFQVKRSDGTTFKDMRALALDNDETMWIGMKTGGIFVYYNPRNVLTSDVIASQLIIEVDDRAEYLLGAENITDIKIDGGNRKWIATLGGGVFLLNEGGNKQILNLTNENSPLISNNVFSVDINKESGEVFFATELGIISYVGSATEGNTTLSNIVVYPSPVSSNYDGPVIIRGLMEDTTIKIADLSGRLIYETYSNGGTAIWNIRDFDGNRVPSGVYMIFCSSSDGSNKGSTKIFVSGR